MILTCRAMSMISADNDIVIYNSFREDDSSEYLPCSEAFAYSSSTSKMKSVEG